MRADDIIESIGNLHFENTFNPYFERCPVHDSEDAPVLRRRFLCEMLERAAECEVDAIWVGRDLGHRGGRRTGLALTDDVHFEEHLKRWGLDVIRPTTGRPMPERTAAVVWNILHNVDSPVFLWNVFPLHPFVDGDPFSNRSHNAKERKAGIEILSQVIRLVRPKRVVGIGNDAYKALSEGLCEDMVHKVRHPSYGGQSEFLEAMQLLYDIRLECDQSDLFSIQYKL